MCIHIILFLLLYTHTCRFVIKPMQFIFFLSYRFDIFQAIKFLSKTGPIYTRCYIEDAEYQEEVST